ncbi:MAG: polyphosphate kinase 2 family protein [Planctomycetota bacterium]|jgi:PPK2 family polyphosphate:nucleotide phosphotransferase|nr:polyphosphate kinase 2 family protein [Planctomycetota bacterium]
MDKYDHALESLRFDKKKAHKLDKIATDATPGIKNKEKGREQLAHIVAELSDLQYRLYAEAKTALLIVFQAMDTGGKDGVVRKVFGPLNPQGVEVTSFKRPTPDELAHDYLWRVHRRIPARGMIGVFNRSHYEDILVPWAHKQISADEFGRRRHQINNFESHLIENGTSILKFFLHISKAEQKRRLEERLTNPDKNWKFETGDLAERGLWDRYQDTYQMVLEQCSTGHAPWFVIPADCKWYRDWATAKIVRRELCRIHPKLPKSRTDIDGLLVK